MRVNSGEDILKICYEKDLPISEVAILVEGIKGDLSREQIIDKMSIAWKRMSESIEQGVNDLSLKPKMFDDDAKKILEYREQNQTLSGSIMSKAIAYALSVMEVNCSMGRIVAAPTAGSCGVLPAVLMSAKETRNFSDDVVVKGLLTAGIVGSIIGKNASLSGAEGGCQAEIGSASAMAAAAIVEMSGGTPKQALDAAAITIKNVMGLVCDPVAGLVEVPCAKRNAMGTANSLIAADMVLAGVASVIPFDEVVWAMDKVGRSLPASLRETSEGGVAITPTGLRLKKELFNESRVIEELDI